MERLNSIPIFCLPSNFLFLAQCSSKTSVLTWYIFELRITNTIFGKDKNCLRSPELTALSKSYINKVPNLSIFLKRGFKPPSCRIRKVPVEGRVGKRYPLSCFFGQLEALSWF